MAKTILTGPRGTADVLPPESQRWEQIESTLRAVAQTFGYGEVRTPIFETTDLFVRGVGEATDIVEKEMYTFLDKGGRSMTLRPEWTAPVVRALLEHRRLGQDPQQVFYIGPFFRYERPQAGRLRQAHQFGVESFGIAGAEGEYEVIALAVEAMRRVGLHDVTLQINSIGDAACRPAYREALIDHFRPHAALLSDESRRRLERNPLRLLDSKAPNEQELIAAAPSMVAYLCPACREHFERLCRLLEENGIAYLHVPRLVRGFDYYTRTVFEMTSTGLGAQSALCGGGRYDGLVAELGGEPTPAVGFGVGLERLRIALAAQAIAANAELLRQGIQVIALGEAAHQRLVHVTTALRRHVLSEGGALPIFVEYADRKLLAQYKVADRHGARAAIVFGDDELVQGVVLARDLVTRREEPLPMGEDREQGAATILAWYRSLEALATPGEGS